MWRRHICFIFAAITHFVMVTNGRRWSRRLFFFASMGSNRLPIVLTGNASFWMSPHRVWIASRTQRGCGNSSRLTVAGVGGKGEIEGGAAIGLGFGPNLAAVFANDALHRGKPNPAAFKFSRGMKPLKGCEQLLRPIQIEADTIVGDVEGRAAIGVLLANFNFGNWTRSSVFQRIGKQIG